MRALNKHYNKCEIATARDANADILRQGWGEKLF